MPEIDPNEEFDKLAAAVSDADKPVKWIPTPPAVQFKDASKRIRQVSFLKSFSQCGNLRDALTASGINRATERRWRDGKDTWYIQQFKDAYETYCDSIRSVVHNRAIHGVEVPIVGKVWGPLGQEDQIIGYKTQYSDLLLMFHAKKIDPAYKDKYEDTKESDKPTESVSPMTRITIQLTMMQERQNQKIIDITPARRELPAGTVTLVEEGE